MSIVAFQSLFLWQVAHLQCDEDLCWLTAAQLLVTDTSAIIMLSCPPSPVNAVSAAVRFPHPGAWTTLCTQWKVRHTEGVQRGLRGNVFLAAGVLPDWWLNPWPLMLTPALLCNFPLLCYQWEWTQSHFPLLHSANFKSSWFLKVLVYRTKSTAEFLVIVVITVQ